MISEFDPVETRLENGFSVIEASAGTGKTATISAIVLRLIAEQKIEIENILVATYTELATAELRGRIREVLAEVPVVARQSGRSSMQLSRELPIAKKSSASWNAPSTILMRHRFLPFTDFARAFLLTVPSRPAPCSEPNW